MATVAGDIVEVTYNHPTLGSGTLNPKSGEDAKYDLGGIKTSDDANNIDGSGSPIWQKNRTMGFFECLISNDMNTKEDLEKVALLAADPVPAQWTFAIINGVVYGGEGMPVGAVEAGINQGTMTLKVAAPQFKKIAG